MASVFPHMRPLLHIATLLGCFASSVAQASYTVIDDDLLPTNVVEARKQSNTADQVDVPFAKNSIVLGPLAKHTIDQALPLFQNNSIKLVGRPDANPSAKVIGSDGTSSVSLSSARANAMRQYLLRQGLLASNITVTTDDSPNPQISGSNYPSQILLTIGSQNQSSADGAIRSFAGKTYVLSLTDVKDGFYMAELVEQAGGQVLNRSSREIIFCADAVTYRQLADQTNDFRNLKRDTSRKIASKAEQVPIFLTPPITPSLGDATPAKPVAEQVANVNTSEKAEEAKIEKLRKANEAKAAAAEKAEEAKQEKLKKAEEAKAVKAAAAEKAAEEKMERIKKAEADKAAAAEKAEEAKKEKIRKAASAKLLAQKSNKANFTVPVVIVAGGKTTIQWRGDVSELVKRLAREADANFGGLQGTPKPLPVEISIAGESVKDALEIIGRAMGDTADLVLLDNQYFIRYKEAK